MKDLTTVIQEALAVHRCRIIPNASIYLTDRPENYGKRGSRGSRGNSDVEAGHSFDLVDVVRSFGDHRAVRMSLNNIRIFGRIADVDFPHYHGYSQREWKQLPGSFHFIFMTVQSIARIDTITGGVRIGECQREATSDGKPGLILIYEEDGVLLKEGLRVGDAIALPSGVYHTFAAADGVFASYGAIEVCDDERFMYQVHYEESERDPRETIANTIQRVTGVRPSQVAHLTLGDIPGFEDYVEKRPICIADGIGVENGRESSKNMVK